MLRKKNRIEKVREFFRYLRNELTMQERNSFERDLQKDPFSEEAMDGYNLLSPEEIAKDYIEIKRNLKKRTRRNRMSVIYRIAASVIILAGITSIIIITNGKRSHEQIAINTLPKEPIEIQMSDPLTQPRKEIKSAQLNTESKKYAEKEPVRNSTSSELLSSEKQESKKDEKVTDENINNENKRQDLMSESVSSEEEKSKVLVQAPAGSVARSRSFVTDFIPATPVSGKKEFEKYISDNIHNPDTLTGRKIVDISFIVHADGTIDTFLVIRSPGKQFAEEAERLVKSGPAWKPAEREGIAVDDKVELRIIFR